MKYCNAVPAVFVDRPNRFVAHVEVEGRLETVHVKNTGRCKELLIPGVEVMLEKSDNPSRKTAYDLISVNKAGLGWINIDSQVPNKVVGEWLAEQRLDLVHPEYTIGDSRIDFYLERGAERILMEVKGCTLEIEGVGYFPDAPTERGVKHLRELTRLQGEGYTCYVAFVIAMPGITEVRPNVATHPQFGVALQEAVDAGVQVLNLTCDVKPDSLAISAPPVFV